MWDYLGIAYMAQALFAPGLSPVECPQGHKEHRHRQGWGCRVHVCLTNWHGRIESCAVSPQGFDLACADVRWHCCWSAAGEVGSNMGLPRLQIFTSR